MSRTGIVLLAVGVMSMALTIVLRQRSVGDADHTTSSDTTRDEAAVAPVRPPPAQIVTPTSKGATPVQATERAPVAANLDRQVSPEHKGSLPNEGTNSGDRSPDTDVVDSTTVIGRPFPVSSSVRAGCKQGGCPELDKLLSKFSEEPRDAAWAADMEARLRGLAIEEPDKFNIRTIECRTSLCVVEVSSIFGPFLGIPDGNPLYRSLFNGVGNFGYERDPSSARITVTLQTFERR